LLLAQSRRLLTNRGSSRSSKVRPGSTAQLARVNIRRARSPRTAVMPAGCCAR